MRLYNGTSSSINLPLNNGQRLVVDPKSASGQFLPSVELLSLVVSAYSRNDIALILSGATEVQMCSSVSTIPGYIAQSIQEAIERFSPIHPETVTVEEPSIESKLEEKVITPSEEVTAEVIEDELEDKKESESSKIDKKKNQKSGK